MPDAAVIAGVTVMVVELTAVTKYVVFGVPLTYKFNPGYTAPVIDDKLVNSIDVTADKPVEIVAEYEVARYAFNVDPDVIFAVFAKLTVVPLIDEIVVTPFEEPFTVSLPALTTIDIDIPTYNPAALETVNAVPLAVAPVNDNIGASCVTNISDDCVLVELAPTCVA